MRAARRILLLRVQRRLEAVVDGEQAVELRDRQQLADAVRGVDEDQLAVAVAEAAEVADQLADAGGVDVVDAREVDEHVALVLLQRALQGLGEELGALAELDDALDVEQGGILDAAFFDDHGSVLAAQSLAAALGGLPRACRLPAGAWPVATIGACPR